MLYLFEVYALVAGVAFSLSGLLLLAMFGWQQAREYSHARQIMNRVATGIVREPVTISRNRSRFRETESLRFT